MHYLLTAHDRLVARGDNDELIQIPYSPEVKPSLVVTDNEDRFASGPMAGFDLIHADGGVHFNKGGKFLCAPPNDKRLVANRDVAAAWETFTLITEAELEALPAVKSHLFDFPKPEDEVSRFAARVSELISRQEPVKLYVGSGTVPRVDFLNLDISCEAPVFAISNPEQYFIFPYADMPWGIPDNSVDYIFHEDFIEHIPQLQQIQFMAEALRVLKPGCFHRVNTPNLIAAMKQNSTFKAGFTGVYTGERQWGHIALFSPAALKEIAELVGYREIVFTTRDHGVSPFAAPDYRPGPDRDPIFGNIYADLMK